jgi:cell wall-associated protease
LQYLLDGKLVYTDANISGSTTFGNMMLQAYNFGDENYDVYWDNVASHPIGWTEPLETPAKEVERISGKNRYATAAAAKNKLPDWGHSKDLVIASGDSRHQPDALTAAGLSGAYHAPLLLVPTNYLDADARAAIAAMPKGVRVHIVGAAPAVSTKVRNQIASIAGVKSVERISGADRYATAAAVARKMKSVLGGAMPRSALLTNGESASLLLDPLVAGTVSVSRHYPILLLKKSSVPASTRSALASLRLSTRYIVGGPTAVSESVRKSISVTAENRIYGADVAGDAVAFAQHAKANGWLTGSLVGFAAAVPDAATGGVYMGAQGGPMLVVKPGSVPAVTADFLSANKASITGGYLFGGPPAVNELVRTQLRDAIN